MEKNENKIKQIVKYGCIVLMFIFLFLIFLELKTEYYDISLESGSGVDKASGILTKSFWRNTFYLNIDFDNPDNHRTVGLFILKNENLEVLESSESGSSKAFMTESGYAVTNQIFKRIEKRNGNGNITSKILKNMDNIYVCISKNDIENIIKVEDCHKIIFNKI